MKYESLPSKPASNLNPKQKSEIVVENENPGRNLEYKAEVIGAGGGGGQRHFCLQSRRIPIV